LGVAAVSSLPSGFCERLVVVVFPGRTGTPSDLGEEILGPLPAHKIEWFGQVLSEAKYPTAEPEQERQLYIVIWKAGED